MAIQQQVGISVPGVLDDDWRLNEPDLPNGSRDLTILVTGFCCLLDRLYRQDGCDRHDNEVGAKSLGDYIRSVRIGGRTHTDNPSEMRCSRKAGIVSRRSALSKFEKFSSSRSSRIASTMNSKRLWVTSAFLT